GSPPSAANRVRIYLPAKNRPRRNVDLSHHSRASQASATNSLACDKPLRFEFRTPTPKAATDQFVLKHGKTQAKTARRSRYTCGFGLFLDAKRSREVCV